jgi:hypothetical protein
VTSLSCASPQPAQHVYLIGWPAMLVRFFAAGPGPNRFGRDQKPAKLKRDHVLTLLVVGFVAFRIAIGLPRVHYGWTPVESFAP